MTFGQKKRERAETQRWLEQEKFRRTETARRLAAERRRLDGFSVIRLPSIVEGLDELQPPATRNAGGGR